MDSRRTFYRIPKQFPVTFRRRRGDACRGISTTISCEGASIQVSSEQAEHMHRGEHINVGLVLDGDKLTLPAVVAWVRPDGHRDAHVGLKLMLALADATTRTTYAEWIVAETRSVSSRAPARPSRTRPQARHGIVAVQLSAAQRMALRDEG